VRKGTGGSPEWATPAIAEVGGLQAALDGKLGTAGGDLTGNIRFADDAEGITTDTADGADNQSVILAGGGGANRSRGAYLVVFGNEAASPGCAHVHLGSNNGIFRIYEKSGSEVFGVSKSVAQHNVAFRIGGGGGQQWYASGNDSIFQAGSTSHRIGVRPLTTTVAFLGYQGLELPSTTSFSTPSSTCGIHNGGVAGRLVLNHNNEFFVAINGTSQIHLTSGIHTYTTLRTALSNGSEIDVLNTTQFSCGYIRVFSAINSKVATFRVEATTVTLIDGDTGFFAATDTASRLCLYNNSGMIRLKNNSGSTIQYGLRIERMEV
jgi:hypothetical protein